VELVFLGVAMASATACASTAFAGQTLLKQSSELSRKVGSNEARVQMRGSKSSSSSSIWFDFSQLLIPHTYSTSYSAFFPPLLQSEF
jgi:hypothetical protein